MNLTRNYFTNNNTVTYPRIVTMDYSPPSAGQDNSDNNNITVTVTSTDVVDKGKKITLFEANMRVESKVWSVIGRYNDFSKLHDVLKKTYPGVHLKFPGKKFFGNNFSPEFIRSRRQGLEEFSYRIISDRELMNHPDVRSFFRLNEHLESNGSTETDSAEDRHSPEIMDTSSDKTSEKSVDLGPSERPHVKPTDFEFLKVIGKGSFGKVLLARHKTEDTTYAVKVLQKKMILKRNEKNHIMCERYVLLKNLYHPFLVGLHYSFQSRDKLYFVLDYVNGGELFFHLQKERYFSEPRARFYAAEITSALGYLHSEAIVYRDLKPENILLDSAGHVVLTDFGLCKHGLRNHDTTTTFCGTPEYLAPEVLRKEAYDRCVDWWCLGAVLYEMLYGLPPFYSRDTAEMYDNILHKPVRLRTNISLAARDILDGLLQKNRHKRLGHINDAADIKSHEFFKPINWTELEAKQIMPPFDPNVRGSLDLKNIDPEFTREPIPASVIRSNGIGPTPSLPDNAFQGFSYVPPTLQLTS